MAHGVCLLLWIPARCPALTPLGGGKNKYNGTRSVPTTFAFPIGRNSTRLVFDGRASFLRGEFLQDQLALALGQELFFA